MGNSAGRCRSASSMPCCRMRLIGGSVPASPRGLKPAARWSRLIARGCAVAVALVALLSCAGPQPLNVAIRQADETTYLTYLDAAGADGRDAYVAWMAAQRDQTRAQVLADDARLSSTRNPFDAHDDPQAVSRGAVIYRFHCARCHGDDARGRGPSVLPNHPATDFKTFGKRLAATLHRGAPKKWFRVINEGSGDVVDYPDGESTAMPAFADELTREQIWLVITYLQSLDIHAEELDEPEHSTAASVPSEPRASARADVRLENALATAIQRR